VAPGRLPRPNELKFDGLSAFERFPADANGPAYAGFRDAPRRTRTSDTRFRKPCAFVSGRRFAVRRGSQRGSRIRRSGWGTGDPRSSSASLNDAHHPARRRIPESRPDCRCSPRYAIRARPRCKARACPAIAAASLRRGGAPRHNAEHTSPRAHPYRPPLARRQLDHAPRACRGCNRRLDALGLRRRRLRQPGRAPGRRPPRAAREPRCLSAIPGILLGHQGSPPPHRHRAAGDDVLAHSASLLAARSKLRL
jgi:hypothetical protein